MLRLSLGSGVELPFPPENFIYPARVDWPDCMMLAFQPGHGIIGSYVLQGRTLFIDQDNHSIAFLSTTTTETSTLTPADDVGITMGALVAAGLIFGGVYWVWDRRRDEEYAGYALMIEELES